MHSGLLAPTGAQEMQKFVRPCLKLTIFIFLARIKLSGLSIMGLKLSWLNKSEPKILRLVSNALHNENAGGWVIIIQGWVGIGPIAYSHLHCTVEKQTHCTV